MLVIRSTVVATFLLYTAAVPISNSPSENGQDERLSPDHHLNRAYWSVDPPQDVHTTGIAIKSRRDREVSRRIDHVSAELSLLSSHEPVERYSELVDRAGPQESQSIVLRSRLSMAGVFNSRFEIGDRIASMQPEATASGEKTNLEHQVVVLSIDSVSPRSFVVSSKCGKSCDGLKGRYDPELSKTYTSTEGTLDLTYPSGLGGHVTGTLAIDNVQGVQHKFGVATTVPRSLYAGGVMSIAFQPAGKRDNALNSFVWGLKEAAKIASAQITLSPSSTSISGTSRQLEVVFGTFDFREATLLARAEVIINRDNLWKIPGQLYVDGKPFTASALVISTGTPWVTIPTDLARKFYDDSVPGATTADDEVSGRYTVPCGTELSGVKVKIGNQQAVNPQLELPPDWFSVQVPNRPPNTCYGAFVGSDDTDTVVIGSSILSRYVLNLDLEAGRVTLYS